jgi:hypothetical protein
MNVSNKGQKIVLMFSPLLNLLNLGREIIKYD